MIKQYHKSSISLLDCKILAVDKDLSNQVEDADRAWAIECVDEDEEDEQ